MYCSHSLLHAGLPSSCKRCPPQQHQQHNYSYPAVVFTSGFRLIAWLQLWQANRCLITLPRSASGVVWGFGVGFFCLVFFFCYQLVAVLLCRANSLNNVCSFPFWSMSSRLTKPLVLCYPGGVTESPPEGVQSLLCFFHQQNVNLSKWNLSPKLSSAEAGLTEPLSQELGPVEFPDSLHSFFTALTPACHCFISSICIRCQDSGISGRKSLKWSSVSLSPCEVTKQNFISTLSNWTTLITSVIFFLPCVISP